MTQPQQNENFTKKVVDACAKGGAVIGGIIGLFIDAKCLVTGQPTIIHQRIVGAVIGAASAYSARPNTAVGGTLGGVAGFALPYTSMGIFAGELAGGLAGGILVEAGKLPTRLRQLLSRQSAQANVNPN